VEWTRGCGVSAAGPSGDANLSELAEEARYSLGRPLALSELLRLLGSAIAGLPPDIGVTFEPTSAWSICTRG
jgi:hypothetical protein